MMQYCNITICFNVSDNVSDAIILTYITLMADDAILSSFVTIVEMQIMLFIIMLF